MNQNIIKIGITPSNAPFRISNLRTFIYAYCIFLNLSSSTTEKDSKLIFQIDDTNPNKRLFTDTEIIDFYKKIGIINEKVNISYTNQINNTKLCEYYYNELLNQGYITIKNNGVSYFNILKYIENFDSTVEIIDEIRGIIKFDARTLAENDLFAIRRSDGSFLYHFASCIDNISFELTRVIRGSNKLTSSAYQVLLCKCLKIKLPIFVHLPLLIEKDKNSRKTIYELLDNGYDLKSIISYLISSGYGDPEKIYYSYDDFAKNLEMTNFHISDANFDLDILKSNSNKYLKKVSYEEYFENIVTTAKLNNYILPENLIESFFKNKLNYLNIKKYLKLLYSEGAEEITDEEEIIVEKIKTLINMKLSATDIVKEMNNVNPKIIYELIQWIFTGNKLGTSSSALIDIYNASLEINEDKNFILKKRGVNCEENIIRRM